MSDDKPVDGAACWISGKDANAICQFCGRFVNKEHANFQPFPMAVFVGENNTPKVLVVSGAVWCGVCRPQQDPMSMPEIY